MVWREPYTRARKWGAAAASSFPGRFVLRLALLAAFGIAPLASPAGAADVPGKGIAVEKVADLIAVIVAANREAYGQIVVNRLMIQEKVIAANEQYLQKKLLPLPAQFFRAGAELSAKKNTRAVYSLESFWSIHPQNFPKTEMEKIGLAKVLGGTGHFYGAETLGSQSYFIAAYPDIGTNEACVRCHNQHPGSRRQDFQIGEVMGGVVVRIPIAQAEAQAASQTPAATDLPSAPGLPPASGIRDTIPPASISYQDTADIVASIVAANREVYADLAVGRLAIREAIIAVDEQYLAKKCLPLPEQLFNLGAMLAAGKTRSVAFALRSNWALNKSNLPASDTEKAGLAAVSAGGERYYGVETSGAGKTFVAIYPDKASSEACVTCHNQHPNATRRDFKTGDAIGGIAVRIPITD